MRFPIRLTQKTRESVENGVFRSFLRFVEDLHGVVVEQHEGEGGWGGVDDSATDVNTALMRVANVLTLESCRVLDRAAMVQQARDVCVSYIERCRQDVVHAECAGLRTLASACNVVIDCLRRFSKESTRIGKGNVVDRMRAFLKTAQRKGLSAAARGCGPRRGRCGASWRRTGGCTAGGSTTRGWRASTRSWRGRTTGAGAHADSWGSSRRIGWLVRDERGQPVLVRALELATGKRVEGALRAGARAPALPGGRGAACASRASRTARALTRAT